MKKFVAEQEFWDLFPHAKIGVVGAHGIDNTHESGEAIKAGLEKANKAALAFIPDPILSENAVVKVWREAFQKFNTKKGARSSIEALLKRVSKGNAVGSINPLVDIYNTISLSYGLPCGGEDINTFVGDLRLTVTKGGDEFKALGDEEPSETLPGEVCYLDNAGAVCRCWNWRDGVRTMLTPDTKNAVLVIESVDPSRDDALEAAIADLTDRIRIHLGGRVEHTILTKDHPETTLSES